MSLKLKDLIPKEQKIAYNQAPNSYPCGQGAITRNPNQNKTIIFAYSHPMTCILNDPNTIDIILTRSPFNTNINGKQMPKFKDNDISTLD